jgi:hypothetical protein
MLFKVIERPAALDIKLAQEPLRFLDSRNWLSSGRGVPLGFGELIAAAQKRVHPPQRRPHQLKMLRRRGGWFQLPLTDTRPELLA